jgi:CO/xanthine dehydrogenase Mo-binding subunit
MLDRREFLTTIGGGVAVLVAPGAADAQRGEALPQDLSAWLHIGKDGMVTACTGKVEAGQGIRTSLAQAVAEELRTPLATIRFVMGDTDLTPFDMGTFGSRTTPTMAPQLRRAAAAARELLVDLAAKRWNTERTGLLAQAGKVRKAGESISYGELADGQKLIRTIPADIALTPAAEWKVAGAPAPKSDARAIVTGQHQYPSDITRPGMLYGKVVRPPSFRAKLDWVDGSKAEALPGVKVVRDGDFLGVAAPHPRVVERAAALIETRWSEAPVQASNADLFAFLKQHAATGERAPAGKGSLEKGLAQADVRLKQTYTVAYIAHCPLETRAAVAEWNDGKLTVWTGTQRPFGVRGELAEKFGIPEDRVHVIMPDMGAGYGGKHSGDAAVEAARLAKAAARPVKLVWTRQEEFTWAYFRPSGVIEVESGATRAGLITAWDFRNINSGGSGMEMAYEVPNQRMSFEASETPLRQGSYRALAATANHFARETHIDELAHELRMDPLEFRLRNTQDPRFRAVLTAAARRFGWGRRRAPVGHGFGIAAGWEKGGYIATCAEVAIEERKVQVRHVVAAFECGAIVNPDNLRNQVEGAVIMGLGGALFEAIEFSDGRILNGRLAKYRVPRFSDVPAIETVLLDRKDLPSSGAGECPIVGIAPAIGNAIFEAAGVRLRSLPLAPRGLPA